MKSEERAKADRDTKEREAREGAERESKENERMKKVRVMREAEKKASETDNKDQEQWVGLGNTSHGIQNWDKTLGLL